MTMGDPDSRKRKKIDDEVPNYQPPTNTTTSSISRDRLFKTGGLLPGPKPPLGVDELKLTQKPISSSSSRHIFFEKSCYTYTSPWFARSFPLISLLIFPLTSSVSEVPNEHLADLLIQKLEQCANIYDFTVTTNAVSKDIKGDALLDIIECVAMTDGVIMTDSILPLLFRMVEMNLFHPLPPPSSIPTLPYDADEDDPVLEASWPHIQLVYELLLKVLETCQVKSLANYVTASFTSKLIDLTASQDPRERDSIKLCIHKIYGKFVVLRVVIRKLIFNLFSTVVIENQRHLGLSELLEILGSIINGFAIPLKSEHRSALFQNLMPLHKCASLSSFHPQLTYCITQFLEKDSTLIDPILKALFKYWPKTNSAKSILFLAELEELFYLIDPADVGPILLPTFRQLSKCINHTNFQVAERALYFLDNEYFLEVITDHLHVVLPLLFDPLYDASLNHWSSYIRKITGNCLRLFKQINLQFCQSLERKFKAESLGKSLQQETRRQKWEALELSIQNRAKVEPDEPEDKSIEEIPSTPPECPEWVDLKDDPMNGISFERIVLSDTKTVQLSDPLVPNDKKAANLRKRSVANNPLALHRIETLGTFLATSLHPYPDSVDKNSPHRP